MLDHKCRFVCSNRHEKYFKKPINKNLYHFYYDHSSESSCRPLQWKENILSRKY